MLPEVFGSSPRAANHQSARRKQSAEKKPTRECSIVQRGERCLGQVRPGLPALLVNRRGRAAVECRRTLQSHPEMADRPSRTRSRQTAAFAHWAEMGLRQTLMALYFWSNLPL